MTTSLAKFIDMLAFYCRQNVFIKITPDVKLPCIDIYSLTPKINECMFQECSAQSKKKKVSIRPSIQNFTMI